MKQGEKKVLQPAKHKLSKKMFILITFGLLKIKKKSYIKKKSNENHKRLSFYVMYNSLIIIVLLKNYSEEIYLIY